MNFDLPTLKVMYFLILVFDFSVAEMELDAIDYWREIIFVGSDGV